MVVLFAAAPIIGVITFHARGLYKLVTRFIGPEGTARIYVAVIIAVLAWALLVLLSGVKGHPRSVVVIYGLIAAGLIRLSRQWAGAMLLRAAPQHQPVKFPGAQERHHLWRRHYRHPVAPRPERDRRLQHGRLHRQQPVARRPGGAWRQGAQARQDRQGDHHRECQRGAARHALGAAQRAARRDQGARALPGVGEDAARARRDRLGPCRGERLEADRGRGSARARSGRAGARAPHRACEGQGGDDHRRRRLDRLGADPSAARAWTEGAHPVRAVGGGALRDRDGDRGEQMAPGEGA